MSRCCDLKKVLGSEAGGERWASLATSFTDEGTAQRRKGTSYGPTARWHQGQDWDPGIPKPFPPHDSAQPWAHRPACWSSGESSGDGPARPLTSSLLATRLPHGSPDTSCQPHPQLFFLPPPRMSSPHPVQAGLSSVSKTAADIPGVFTCARHTH